MVVATSLLFSTACGASAPQKQDEVGVVYRASFRAEPGVTAKVVFPWIADGTAFDAQLGLVASDGGSFSLETTADGLGLGVSGQGQVSVSFSGDRVKGLEAGTGIPNALLTREVPDGGVGDRLFHVNKGGSATVQVDFEYTASRNCGDACGGRRSFTYLGPVGLSRQQVTLQVTEEKQQ